MMKLPDLQSIFGAERVSDTLENRLAYGRDASNLSGDCLAVVWPVHLDEVCALAQWASREGFDLVPRGAGTGLCGGATPQNSIVVDFSCLTAIGPVDVERRRVRVGAGAVLDALNRALEPHHLCLPVVPSSHLAATLGGMIATNASGLRAVRYGSMRNWVEAVTLVDGNGRVHHLNGTALDDVAGREGASGFVVEAELMLTEQLRQRSLTLRAFDDTAALLTQRADWLADPSLTALEYINRHAAQVVGWPARPHLLAEFEGDGGEIGEPAPMAELWRRRDSLGPQLSSRGLPISEDPRVQGDGLGSLLDWLEAEQIPAFGHLGVGIVHPRFRPGDERVAQLYQQLEAWGGQVSGEHGIGLKKKAWVSASYRNEIRQLKALYDPNNVLNRGKLC
jgi:FAD/FMN-containing dehydrogenase